MLITVGNSIVLKTKLGCKKGMANESRTNLTHILMTKLITTRTDIRMEPKSMLIVELYSLYC